MAENFPNARLEYRYFWIRLMSRRRHGRVAMPPAALAADGAPLPPKIIQVHSPIGYLVVQWRAEGYGRVPVVPSPESPDPNLVLDADDVSWVDPKPDPANGRHFWELAGEYVYTLLNPIDPTKGLPGIALPLELDARSAASNTIPGDVFVKYLIGLTKPGDNRQGS